MASDFDEFLKRTAKKERRVTISANIPYSVAEALRLSVLRPGNEVTRQQIITEALIHFLGLRKSESALPSDSPESPES